MVHSSFDIVFHLTLSIKAMFSLFAKY